MIRLKKEKIIVRPRDLRPLSADFEIIGTTNPGAVRVSNGDIVLYVRVIEKLKRVKDEGYFYSPRFNGKEKIGIEIDKFPKEGIKTSSEIDFVFNNGAKRLTYFSYLKRIVLDRTGENVKSIEKGVSFPPLSWDGELGVEDARIVKIGKLYVMTYVALGRDTNICTNVAVSNDCKNWNRRGIVFEEQNKDVVIFPELIDGRYVSFNRPEGSFEFTHPHIWISYSKNLEDWGRSRPFILAREGRWDSDRIGAGPPPIRTKQGWLFIYHGVTMKRVGVPLGFFDKLLKRKVDIESYSAGAVLLDLKDPGKIIAKSEGPLIVPRLKEEKKNIVRKEVVFPIGLVWDLNGKDLLVYSGGGDELTTVRKIGVDDILNSLRRVH